MDNGQNIRLDSSDTPTDADNEALQKLAQDLEARSGDSLVLTQITSILVPVESFPRFLDVCSSSSSSAPVPSPQLNARIAFSFDKKLFAGLAVASGVAASVLGFLVFWACKRKRKDSSCNMVDFQAQNRNRQCSLIAEGHLHKELLEGIHDRADTKTPNFYSYEELKDATDDFCPASLIKGSVYKGFLSGQHVAIKEMRERAIEELTFLCKVHHKNLVRLVGISDSPQYLYLVYEYLESGSLYDCLHSQSSTSPLTNWNTVLQIALDVATGLEFVHDFTSPNFVHKDIKSSNILLDNRFHAKIANFGTAKISSTSQTAHMIRNQVVGTQGYISPECAEHGIVSTKLDIYALGVVFLELLSGLEPVLGDRFLAGEIGPILNSDNAKDRLQNWIGSKLQNEYPLDCVYKFAVIARACVDDNPSMRPSAKEITYRLSKLLEASLEWEAAAVQRSLQGK